MGIPRRPGLEEDARFKCGPSVAKWKYWKSGSGAGSAVELNLLSKSSGQGNLAELAIKNLQTSLSSALSQADSPEAARYWGYHVARSSFFATQGLIGVAVRDAPTSDLSISSHRTLPTTSASIRGDIARF